MAYIVSSQGHSVGQRDASDKQVDVIDGRTCLAGPCVKAGSVIGCGLRQWEYLALPGERKKPFQLPMGVLVPQTADDFIPGNNAET
jgi:hypothetical protein